MAPKADKDVVFFLASAGKHPPGGDVNYFEKAKEVMMLIIEKKIFLRPNDEVGIMLAACSEHDNDRACAKLYGKNYIPSWDKVKDVRRLKKSDMVFDDWKTAISDTLQAIKQIQNATRIILILLFDCHPTCPGIETIDTQEIAKTVQNLKVDLLWIGSKPLKDIPNNKLNESEKVLMDLIKQSNGEYMTIDKTLPSLRIFKPNKTRFMAWKCDLEVGKIKIPISMYVQATAPLKPPPFQTIKTKVENDIEISIVVKPEREYVDRYKEARSVEDTISGYMYGRQCIPVPEADKAGMNYSGGPKSFKVFGFVQRDEIKLEDQGGDTSRFVIPQSSVAAKAFYSLVQALVDLNRVAVVRRVYQVNNCPKVGVLIPYIVPAEPWGLIYIETLFAEDRRFQTSNPLASMKSRLTKEKENAVANLIDSMMLTGSDDDPEPFCPGSVHSPGLQRLYNCLSHRALNPDKPVPEIDEYLRKLIEPPESIKVNSKPLTNKLRDLFPITDEPVLTKKSADTSIEVPVPVVSDVEKKEKKIEQNVDSSNRLPAESNVDLDDLFDDDMDM